ncbi:MAG TPA: HAMP domain-containing methyl-accepting chemotaxis protein [Rhodopila sp.]|uniref:methyl-accepting chemotaxis protein n=1 Tax=Rhodopila sp. TaxID=2480087 RepID=UPI002B71BB54|nr:HAMP domain-containing methyl-accepting chemotaxis protein [Rhodopila sp.]HVY14337.1 HAMP domain-containing methyl-accepting chemotaxis protein [Rhodopila sp.]
MVGLRLLRDVPVSLKLASSVVGALALLCALSWFALDRLAFVTALQATVTEQAAIGRSIQGSLIAAQDLRVVSREVQSQQTATAVHASVERALKQKDLAASLLRQPSSRIDPVLLSAATERLDALMDTVRQVAELRTEVLTTRQKRLFQTRPTFENSLSTLARELSDGAALASGVDSVRGQESKAREGGGALTATLSRYRIAMGKLQQSALMFIATGNGGAANEIRDAKQEQEAAMAALLNADIPASVRDDARLTQTIGKGIAEASIDLIAMTRKLDQVAGAEMDGASRSLEASFQALSAAAERQEQAAVAAASAAGRDARRNILTAIGVAAAAMMALGTGFTRLIARPIRRLTDVVQAIAEGQTDQAVPYVTQRDEVGRMAASVETLRGVMRETFIQSQMIEQLPVGVMTAAPTGDFAITYCNAEARQVLERVQDQLAVPADALVGKGLAIFRPYALQRDELIADPSNLPYQSRFALGAETLDLKVTAIFDRQGRYAGPLLIWRRATDQVRLVTQFEQSVGRIAHTVATAADGMKEAAMVMRAGTVDAGQRTVAVSAASDQASHSVSTAAAGAEQVAVSVAEIGRQVAESARIAAQAVAEAEATNASVSSLASAAQQINAVISLIRDIAGRTNLLALNATIEAARAGEAGKGFAVVASEVKNLATQTAKATEDIGGQIQTMQQATADAVNALRLIGATIERMNGIAGNIADAVDQQGQATQSIAIAVQHAAAGTAEVNGNISAVAQAVEETSHKAGSLLESATGMSEQASMLQDEVAGFLRAVQQAA